MKSIFLTSIAVQWLTGSSRTILSWLAHSTSLIDSTETVGRYIGIYITGITYIIWSRTNSCSHTVPSFITESSGYGQTGCFTITSWCTRDTVSFWLLTCRNNKPLHVISQLTLHEQSVRENTNIVKGRWRWHTIINTTHCVVLITRCHNSQKHSQSTLTNTSIDMLQCIQHFINTSIKILINSFRPSNYISFKNDKPNAGAKKNAYNVDTSMV